MKGFIIRPFKITGVVLVSLGSLFSLTACKKEAGWKARTYIEQNVKPQASEVQIPESLWQKITALNVKPEKPKASSAPESTEEVKTPETVLEPLKVYFGEKNKGVLKVQNVALSFVAGGGELDLSDYVGTLRGSYYLAFEFMPEIEAGDTRVFFFRTRF